MTTIIFFVMTTGDISATFFNMISSQSLRKGKISALEKMICMCQSMNIIKGKLNCYWEKRANIENVSACKKRRENFTFQKIGLQRLGKGKLSFHTDKDIAKEIQEAWAWKPSSVGVLPPLVTAV